MSRLFLGLTVTILSVSGAPVMADQCMGIIVNGQCIGPVLPDYDRALEPRQPDSYFSRGRSYPTSPQMEQGFNRRGFFNRTEPIIQDGEMRFYDPRER